MIPELDLAIVVLTNQMNGMAFNTITNTIKDSYLGYDNRNWLTFYGERNTRYLKYNDSIKSWCITKLKKWKIVLDFQDAEMIVGTYTDDWFGDIVISKSQGQLNISCIRSPRLVWKTNALQCDHLCC